MHEKYAPQSLLGFNPRTHQTAVGVPLIVEGLQIHQNKVLEQ